MPTSQQMMTPSPLSTLLWPTLLLNMFRISHHEPTLKNYQNHDIQLKCHHIGTTINQVPSELQQCTCNNSTKMDMPPPSSIYAMPSIKLNLPPPPPAQPPFIPPLPSQNMPTGTWPIMQHNPTSHWMPPPPGFYEWKANHGDHSFGMTKVGQGCGYSNRTCNNFYVRHGGNSA